MKLHFIILIQILTGISLNLYSQEIRQSDITDIAEELAEDESDPEAAVNFLERLHELAENPVKINSADGTELSRLFFLTDFQIKALADHVKSTGMILSVYEIASIPGFDRRTAEIMNPLITLESHGPGSKTNIRIRNRLLSNFIIKPEGNGDQYPGPPWKILTKYKIDGGPFTAGFTAEKDPGEKIISGSPPLPDFLSGYAEYSGKRLLRKVIAGDFSVKFGQGTAINNGIHTGIPLTAIGYFPSRNDIKPYTSSDENNFFRGVAAGISAGKADLLIFISHNRIDATTELSDDSSEVFITRLYKTGLHNTASGMLKKDVVAETAYGANLGLNLNHVTFGMNWSGSSLSLPLKNASAGPEEIFDLTGIRQDIYSAYFTASAERSLLFGEFSATGKNSFAMVQGFTLRASDRLTINGLYRNYSPGYGGLHSRGPGNSSTGCNEEGILGNFTFEASRHLFVSAGYDLCRYPWLRYRTSYPSVSKRYEVKFRYLPTEKLNIEIAYLNRYSMNDEQTTQGVAGRKTTSSGTFRALFRYTLNETLSLNCRMDFKSVRESGSRGWLMSQDIIYRSGTLPLTLWGRYCIFKTGDWDSRIYVYENDLLYSFSIPAFSQDGSRTYLMAGWRLADFAEFRIKYSLTSMVENNIPEYRNELRIQLRIWF